MSVQNCVCKYTNYNFFFLINSKTSSCILKPKQKESPRQYWQLSALDGAIWRWPIALAHGYGYTWTSYALWAVFFGTTKKIDRLLYKLSNKHSNEKLFFIKVVSISRFHYKSFIKSLIFKIFFSGWFALCLHFSVASFSKHE